MKNFPVISVIPFARIAGLGGRRSDGGSRNATLAGFLNQNTSIFLAAVLFLALAMRLIALWSLKGTPYYDHLLMDEAVYHKWALQIAGGNYRPQAAYEFSPLPAYVMALVYKIIAPDVLFVRILNIFLGVLTCFFIASAGKQIGGAWVGILAGLIAALYKPFIFYNIVPLKTSLSLLLCALVLTLLLTVLKRPSPFKIFLLGITLAGAVNVRGNYLAFVPVLAAATCWSARQARAGRVDIAKDLTVFLLALALGLAPFAVRNYRVTGELVVSTTQAGFNFYIGNNPRNPTPYYRQVAFASPSPLKQGVEFTIEASRRSGKVLTAEEASSFWFHEVLREARAHPLIYAKKLMLKALAVGNRFEAFDHYDLDFLSRFMRFLRLPLCNFALIWPLGMGGLFLASITRKELRWVAFLFSAYAATLVLFFVSGRYRLPLLVILIPFTPFGLLHASILYREKKKGLLISYAAATGLFFALLFAPLPGRYDQSLYYNIHASVLEKSGRHQEAKKFLEISSKLHQCYSDAALIRLAERSFLRGDLKKAEDRLALIPDASYKAAAKYKLLGHLFLLQGKMEGAVGAFRKSLSINSAQNSVRKKLISLLDMTNPREARKEYRKYDEIRSFYKGL